MSGLATQLKQLVRLLILIIPEWYILQASWRNAPKMGGREVGMTIHQMEQRYTQLMALINWVQTEVQKSHREIVAAREAEEMLLERQYQAACLDADEGYRMLEALGSEESYEDNPQRDCDYSEKYIMDVYC